MNIAFRPTSFLRALPLGAGSLLAAGCLLAGCGSGNTAAAPADNTAAGGGPGVGKSSLKVALLTTGDINDNGWNQLAYEGLQAVAAKTGAQTAHQVTKTDSDQLPAIRDFADNKYDIVLCHGFEYGSKVKTIAPNYPGTKFVVVAGNVKQSPNVATLVPKLEDATYLLGMVAGGMTKTNVVGLLGGEKLPVIASTFDAFSLGARAVNPKVKVLENYVGDFEDQNTGKEDAKAMISQGADVLFHNADQAGKGMFAAARESKNVWVFGSNRDQNALAPSQCLASAVIDIPLAFENVVKSVQDNTFKPDFVELNLKDKTIAVVWNDALKAKIPAPLMKKVLDAEKRIETGKLVIKRNVS